MIMTSLKEEIGNSIIKYRSDDNYMHYTCVDEILKLIENKIYELMGREDLKEPEDEIDFILLEARFRTLEEVLELLKK